MNTREREFLQSEIVTLESMLREIPPDEPIHRKGFEHRLREAREQLEQLPAEPPAHQGQVLFRGKPVARSHGIYASFAGKAADAFAEAFTTVREGLAGTLGNQGPVAGGTRSDLLITGTSTGSFGFTFEVPEEPDLPDHDEPSSAALAIPAIQRLFQEALQGAEENLADIVADIHPRAAGKVREFLDVLADHGAWCSLDYQNKPFRFGDLTEVQQARHALRPENISESDEVLTGILEGILPTARWLEFRVPDEKKPLRLRIRREFQDVDGLKQLIDNQIRVEVRVTRLSNRTPRYELTSVVGGAT